MKLLQQLSEANAIKDVSDNGLAMVAQDAFHKWLRDNNSVKTFGELCLASKVEHERIGGVNTYLIYAPDIGLHYSDLYIAIGYPRTNKKGFMATVEMPNGRIEYVLCLMVKDDPTNRVDVGHGLPMGTFVHEFTHYLDHQKRNIELMTRRKIKAAQAYYDSKGETPKPLSDDGMTPEQYYNDPLEFNAFYHDGIEGVLSRLLFDDLDNPGFIEKNWLADFDKFRNQAVHSFQRMFIKKLNSKFKKKFISRLYGLYSFLKEQPTDLHALKVQYRMAEGLLENDDGDNEWQAAVSAEDWSEAFYLCESPEMIAQTIEASHARKIEFGPGVDPVWVIGDSIIAWDGKDRFATISDRNDWLYQIDVEDYYPDYAATFNTNFWKRPRFLYHETDEKHLPSILKDGLLPSDQTRGMHNRSVGRAVFTTNDLDNCGGHYGAAILAIDAGAMKSDGYEPEVGQEPPVVENHLLSRLAWMIGYEDFEADIESGIHDTTVIVYGAVPAKYLKRVKK